MPIKCFQRFISMSAFGEEEDGASFQSSLGSALQRPLWCNFISSMIIWYRVMGFFFSLFTHSLLLNSPFKAPSTTIMLLQLPTIKTPACSWDIGLPWKQTLSSTIMHTSLAMHSVSQTLALHTHTHTHTNTHTHTHSSPAVLSVYTAVVVVYNTKIAIKHEKQ